MPPPPRHDALIKPLPPLFRSHKVSSWAFICGHARHRPGVSVSLTATVSRWAKAGQAVVLESRALKAGDTLGFADVILRDAETGHEVCVLSCTCVATAADGESDPYPISPPLYSEPPFPRPTNDSWRTGGTSSS